MSTLTVESLKKTYPEFNLEISLTAESGTLVSLLGPSGCGKSTTLSLITGIENPDYGSITLNNKELTGIPTWSRNIGLVFQNYALFPNMSVYQNISYGLRVRKYSRAEIRERVFELLRLVGLDNYENRSCALLSGGEQQRVALARALAPNPELLLLDEPLSALDAKLRLRLREEIQRIQQELHITTVYVTHDQDEALSISDKIIVMNSGRTEQEGAPEDIYRRPETLFSGTFIGDSSIIPVHCDTQHFDTDKGEKEAEHLAKDSADDYDQIFYGSVMYDASQRTERFQPCSANGEKDHYLFIRPENFSLDPPPEGQKAEFNIFYDAVLKKAVYRGPFYQAIFSWHGYDITVFISNLPAKKDSYTLYARRYDSLIL
ncbi:MAG: ABC transporter ATP-binding protein [Spirochaetia bacterium]|nr:ABC transporter ATP-binding protein [Spirochaetia bacterium]MCF7946571.1 ABC transporter ATP-binding protein [Spirochaetia bacterium]MCF7952915.1 ABC transporter ATP-binding protein [Spirochaetales bacterium]